MKRSVFANGLCLPLIEAKYEKSMPNILYLKLAPIPTEESLFLIIVPPRPPIPVSKLTGAMVAKNLFRQLIGYKPLTITRVDIGD